MTTERNWNMLKRWLEASVSSLQEAIDQEMNEHPGSEDMLLYATEQGGYKAVLQIMHSYEH